jgi:glutamyl-tRNA reductase
MGLFVVGINHRTAPVALRERVAFVPEQLPEALGDAGERLGVREMVILSTCNRTELVGSSDGEVTEEAIAWLADYHHLPSADLRPHIYQHVEDDALHHLIEVASGLDSMVLGEPQVFGQMKSAFAQASEAGAVAGELSRVFHHTFSIAKRVRTDTAIGENPVSVAYAAVRLARHIFTKLADTRALLIGAGETIELVARHLCDCGVTRITVANRSLARAEELSSRFDASPILLAEIPEQLKEADIVISSTGSQLPILGKGAVEEAIRQRRHRPIFMVDIAVPRDIEEQVGGLDDVYLYTIDDLQEIIAENRRARESEARKADEIIADGVSDFQRERRSLDATDTLRNFRSQAEQLRERELARAIRQLQGGGDPEQILSRLSRSLTNKMLHGPSVHLRQAAADGRSDLLELAADLLRLDNEDGR